MFDFKAIKRVPQNITDIVLSATQRKTPTVIRKTHPLPKIRSFYTRKIKFCSNEYIRQLTVIISSFPHVDDIHPFYNDLINVLYDKSQFKTALGHLNTTKKFIKNIATEYIRLVKYGTSLFACKQLKVAAFGKMTKYCEKLKDTLAYLEEVRQHMSRLPVIFPEKRTLLLIGLPNTGKSSFMNILSSADVDVQPYPFTTRSLYLGHFVFNELDWQIIDSPGLLNTDLAKMNNIEMQSVTALAHINSKILFFIDISGTSGYSIKEQIDLYNGIAPLIERNMLIVLSKSDLHDSHGFNLGSLNSSGEHGLLKEFLNGKDFFSCSAHFPVSVHQVKEEACNIHLDQSVSEKMNKTLPLNKLNIIEPEIIPEKSEKMLRTEKIITEKDLERNNDNYIFDERDNYLIKDKHDIIPEIYNGMNISDYLNKEFNQYEAEQIIQKSKEILNKDYDIFDPSVKNELDKRIKVTNIIAKENKRSNVSEHLRNNVRKLRSQIPDAPKKIREPRQFIEKQKKPEYNMRPKHLYR
ncbi:GTP-binding protein CRFG/NOG1 (ODN superfamily) [Pseudoloma neurophilia]|uniref:GTP-binding protein CRFG/NOG1 (ODN superfamily) n=1 Tax=Pseudoloma neurophilia TaxID=146866 RepID=A0A0R0LVX6_9MICR|nr:GTP-binding protein CRFG/NOG1 (ODN superfamily) [Pseudoloma neurophilia]